MENSKIENNTMSKTKAMETYTYAPSLKELKKKKKMFYCDKCINENYDHWTLYCDWQNV